MQSTLAPLFEFEVLNGIGCVMSGAVDTRRLQADVEQQQKQQPDRAYERIAYGPRPNGRVPLPERDRQGI